MECLRAWKKNDEKDPDIKIEAVEKFLFGDVVVQQLTQNFSTRGPQRERNCKWTNFT